MNLKKFKNILITSSKNPDMDGYACMVAYAKILKNRGIKSTPVVFGKLQQEVRYVLRKYKIDPVIDECHSERGRGIHLSDFSTELREFTPIIPSGSRNDKNYDTIILVDTSMRSVLDPKIDPKKVIQIIDHHRDPEKETFPNAEIIYQPIGALATYFVEMLQKEKIKIDKNTSILLYAAILSNTINLKNSVTTNRDHKAADYLEKIIEIPKDKFANDMFAAKSKMIKQHLSQTIKDDINFNWNSVLVSQLEMVDIEKTVNDRFAEIKTTLLKLKKRYHAKMTILNIVGLEECYNIIIAIENQTQQSLEKILKIKFTDHLARTNKILMRKEINPKLKEYLETR